MFGSLSVEFCPYLNPITRNNVTQNGYLRKHMPIIHPLPFCPTQSPYLANQYNQICQFALVRLGASVISVTTGIVLMENEAFLRLYHRPRSL